MSFAQGIPKEFHRYFATWERLEPRSRSNDFARGLEARTADPLWMLTRQWQTGEFQGEDAGSPVNVQLKYSTQALDRIRLGEFGEPFDLPKVPLELIVEQEKHKLDWRSRVQMGQKFERLARSTLADKALALIEAYLIKYPLLPAEITQLETELDRLNEQLAGPMSDSDRETLESKVQTKTDRLNLLREEWTGTDHATRRFLKFMTGRVIDGAMLLHDIDQHTLAPTPGITNDQLLIVVKNFLDWYARLYAQPTANIPEAWRTQQLDYRLELNPAEDDRPIKTRLVAPSYRNGALDWYTFNIAGGLKNDAGSWTSHTVFTHPTNITIAGLSPRWWAFEDANVDFGKLDVSKPDLGKLLLMEFMLIYGDDWFSIPVPVKTGNLVRIDKLTVTDVFGESIEVKSARSNVTKYIKDSGGNPNNPLLRFEMFTLSPTLLSDQIGSGDLDLPGIGDVLLVPPVAGYREESPPLEELRFLHDEGNNKIWCVEHTVQNGLGRPVAGFDAQRERMAREHEAEIARLEAEIAQLQAQLAVTDLPTSEREDLEAQFQEKQQELTHLREGARPAISPVPIYRLASELAENWIPFIPASASAAFQLTDQSIRLTRAQMLRNEDDDKPTPITAMSRLLELPDARLLWLEEAIIPRSGLRVQLTAQRMRWIDGKTYVWLGRKVLAGKGEGNSGLEFDGCILPR